LKQEKKETVMMRHADYYDVFTTDKGRLVLSDILERAHIFKSTFNGNPHEAAFMEGERSLALQILAILDFKPDDVLKLLDEQRKYREKYYGDR